MAWGNDFSDNTNDPNGQSSKERVRVIGAENPLVKSYLAWSQNVSNGFRLTLVGFFVFAFRVHLMFRLIVPLKSRSRCIRQISTAVRFSAESCPTNYTKHNRSTAPFLRAQKVQPQRMGTHWHPHRGVSRHIWRPVSQERRNDRGFIVATRRDDCC